MRGLYPHLACAGIFMDLSPISFLKNLALMARRGPVWTGGPGDIVVELDDNARIIDISATAGDVIGAEIGGLLGRSFYDFVRREDRAGVKAAIAAALGDDGRAGRAVRADFRLLRLRRAPALAEISLRKTAHGHLNALIRDRGEDLARERELRAAVERASEKAAVRADLMADLGHEMKTPLNAMMGFADAMRAETFGPLGHEKYDEYAGLIHSSGAHLIELIGSILDGAKIDAGRYGLSPVLTAPGPLARESAEMIRGEAEKAGLKLTIDIAPDLPEAMIDKRAVKQILLNLLSNAVKFTSDGGIKLSVSEKCGALDFIVRDTGIGMSKPALARLGGRFTEAHKNGVRGTSGAGLGLSLAISLAKLHGGAVVFTSAPGEGTTARLTLPLRKSLDDAMASQGEASEPGGVQSQFERITAYRSERA